MFKNVKIYEQVADFLVFSVDRSFGKAEHDRNRVGDRMFLTKIN